MTAHLNLGTGQVILNRLLNLKNKLLPLKDLRFDRLIKCALTLLFHFDDISNYLDKYVNIVEEISILNRTFVETKVLKLIYAATVLHGIHILIPDHLLLTLFTMGFFGLGTQSAPPQKFPKLKMIYQ